MLEKVMSPSKEDLISLLDPGRDYGDRTYSDVVSGVLDGTIHISPGQRLPVLWDTGARHVIKGTGQPPQTGVSVQQAALREFRERAIDDLPEAYSLLIDGMRKGDPRYDKIYWENLMGKIGEVKGGDAMAVAFKALIDAMQTPQMRTVTVTDVIDG